MLEITCSNDQATGRHVVQFGDEIGTHMDDNVDPCHSSQTDGFDDMFSEDTNYHVNMPLLIHNQSETT